MPALAALTLVALLPSIFGAHEVPAQSSSQLEQSDRREIQADLPGQPLPQDGWSVSAPLVERSLLLDGARHEDFAVVVGERGHVLVSEDSGETWQQQRVPTRSTLCAITMTAPDKIWVTGHDALILHSTDRGKTWNRQFSAPEEEAPLFDLWFDDDQYGFAVGAYGSYVETSNGGRNWDYRSIGEFDAHLYSIAEAGDGTIFVAGEMGTILRSSDRGRNWQQLESPYAGSFFGIHTRFDGSVLVFGLRGNVYRSTDAGNSWGQIDLGTHATLLGATDLPDDSLLLLGLSGAIFRSRDGRNFTEHSRSDRIALSHGMPFAGGRTLLLGENGLLWLESPTPPRSR